MNAYSTSGNDRERPRDMTATDYGYMNYGLMSFGYRGVGFMPGYQMYYGGYNPYGIGYYAGYTGLGPGYYSYGYGPAAPGYFGLGMAPYYDIYGQGYIRRDVYNAPAAGVAYGANIGGQAGMSAAPGSIYEQIAMIQQGTQPEVTPMAEQVAQQNQMPLSQMAQAPLAQESVQTMTEQNPQGEALPMQRAVTQEQEVPSAFDWDAERETRLSSMRETYRERLINAPVVAAMTKLGFYGAQGADSAIDYLISSIVDIGIGIDRRNPTEGKSDNLLKDAQDTRLEERQLFFRGMDSEDAVLEDCATSANSLAYRLNGSQIFNFARLRNRFMGGAIISGTESEMEQRLKNLTDSEFFKSSYPGLDQGQVRDMGLKLMVRLDEKQRPLREALTKAAGSLLGGNLILAISESLGEGYRLTMLGDRIISNSETMRQFVSLTGMEMPERV